jgi:hypothetical protein
MLGGCKLRAACPRLMADPQRLRARALRVIVPASAAALGGAQGGSDLGPGRRIAVGWPAAASRGPAGDDRP